MHKKCQICGASSDDAEVRQQNIVFHHFPSSISRHDICEKWLDVVGNETLRHLSRAELGNRTVCSRHFHRLDYPGPGTKRLYNHAVPKRSILLLFYIFFMSCVGGLLFLMTWLAVMNITRYSAPWFQMTESRIGSSPGVGFRPVLHLTSPLIWYKWTGNEISYRDYVKEMDRFFKVYRESDVKDYTDCSKEILPRQRSKPCYFNLTELKHCAPPAYGYEELSPCVYIKLNKIYGWSPQCYNETSSLPNDMPRYLRNYITAFLGGDVNKMNTVWLSCNGFYPADAQHMGEVDIYPGPGFQAAYFPYMGQEGYMSPLVALKFREPMRDTLITVRCRAWAHNIDGGAEGGGPVDFQLMIGSKD